MFAKKLQSPGTEVRQFIEILTTTPLNYKMDTNILIVSIGIIYWYNQVVNIDL